MDRYTNEIENINALEYTFSHLLTIFVSFLNHLFYPFLYLFLSSSFISFSSLLSLTHSFPQTLLEAEIPEWQVLGILELFRMYERQEPFCTESTKVHSAPFPSPCLVVLAVYPSLLLLFYLMIDQWLFAVLSHHHRSSHHTIISFNS